jgi:protoheme ferro-lyase
MTPLEPYDAVLLLSFGGPEAPEEVLPFLRRVTAGKDIPDERLEAVGQHYHLFGGRSPINDQSRALIAALRSPRTPRAPASRRPTSPGSSSRCGCSTARPTRRSPSCS